MSSDGDQKLQGRASTVLVTPTYSTQGQKASLQNLSYDRLMALLFSSHDAKEASFKDTWRHEARWNPDFACRPVPQSPQHRRECEVLIVPSF